MHIVSFNIRALSPIAQGAYMVGKDVGNFTEARQMRMVGKDGSICSIPVISANSMRGIMRRHLTREYLAALGTKSDQLYFLLANGGALGKALDGYVRPEKVARLRELFPILSAFGSAIYTYLLPGQLNLSFATLRCEELGTGPMSSGELLTEIGFARHLDRAECNYPDGAKPMPYTVEAVMAGAVFDCKLSFLESATDLDKSTVFHGLNLITTLGGKAASGFGQVELSQTFDDQLYLEWLAGIDGTYREEVQIWLKELACSMKSPSDSKRQS